MTKSPSADDDSESEQTVITCDDGRNSLFLTLGLFICDNKRSSSESDKVDEEMSCLENLDRDMALRPFRNTRTSEKAAYTHVQSWKHEAKWQVAYTHAQS